MVIWSSGQRWWLPDMHWRQCMQLPEDQPMPTRWPRTRPLAPEPMAVTRPTTSWPRIMGYWDMPQSLLSTERSEWHRPQCSTATSTSSTPRGPRSTVSRTSGDFGFAGDKGLCAGGVGMRKTVLCFELAAGSRRVLVAVDMGEPFRSRDEVELQKVDGDGDIAVDGLGVGAGFFGGGEEGLGDIAGRPGSVTLKRTRME